MLIIKECKFVQSYEFVDAAFTWTVERFRIVNLRYHLVLSKCFLFKAKYILINSTYTVGLVLYILIKNHVTGNDNTYQFEDCPRP